MKYFLIAGEASGDLHGASLMNELKQLDAECQFQFFGGDLMRAASGVRPVKHIKDMAFMGFWSVLKNLSTIRKNFSACKKAIVKFQPDVVVLIDYPGFNLKIATYVRKSIRIPVYYYISPSVWAWKSNRIKQIKRDVNQMLTIIPFEKEFYASHNYEVEYVGNPSVDSVHEHLDKTEESSYFKKKYFLSEKPIIALLPGSRKQEIAACLPKMIAAARKFSNYQIVISGVNSVHTAFYHEFMNGNNYPVIKHHPYQLIFHADIAVVNSGTATLETALIGTPQVVVYHVMLGRLAYWAKELIIKTKYISLVNILAQKEVVRELYAHLFTVENLTGEMSRILNDEGYRKEMISSYKILREKLGEPGTAQRAAACIYHHKKV
ncbi:MAG: lipid-A-disaccharide synthase [Paludibacter sp.]|nr:lipid-A-disaccharide synthase [Paludibacter sp.]MDD4198250.1 lipid-A-disaccharide synthase [Paludibacter sp.]MDD4428048.1 lipid-A-disaccharide synthase [Paludibacter sp.]